MKARFFALAALVLGLASCQNDFDDANVGVDGEVDFQLAVSAPELGATRADDGDQQYGYDSAFGAIDYLRDEADALRVDWKDVDLRYSLEVYDVESDYTDAVPVKDRQVIIVDKYEPVTFELRLVPNRNYHFVVFADFVEEGEYSKEIDASIEAQAELGIRHNIGNDLRSITLKNEAINDEVADAYFATKDVEIKNSAAQDIKLKRPYGKVRVVATDLHELNLNVDPAAVRVTYDAFNANGFNAVTGVISGVYETTQFVNFYNDVTKTDMDDHIYTGYNTDDYKVTSDNGVTRNKYMTLFTDYILANADQHSIHFTMEVFQHGDSVDNLQNLIKSTSFNTDIPVQRNHLTTVIGNVLTTGTEINVSIDDNFFRPEEVIEAITVKDQKGFIDALATAANQEYAVIELTNDIEWTTGAEIGSTPLIGADAVTKNLVIYGNGSKLIAKGSGVGSIRMANGGTLTLNDVVVVDESVSYAESSWEYGYLEFAGKIVFNNCVFENAIMVEKEDNKESNVCFNTCAFNSNDAQQYDVWVADGLVFFNDCDIEGYRGIKMHEAYGSEVVEVVIDGCRFTNLSKKPGVAMGDLNADTKVVIKNSTFTNCQAGDQGLYIYETDTDVTTFNFTLENNTVAFTANTNETIEEAIAKGGDMVVVAEGEYTLPSIANKDITISGTRNTVITVNKPNMSGTDVTFEGVTIKGSGYATGVQHVNTVTYNDVKVIGEMCLYGEKVVFNNCEFELNNQYIWTYGCNDTTFENCVFNTNGKAILVYNEGAGACNVKVYGCTFNATAGAKAGAIANQNCAAIEIDNYQSSGVGAAHNVTTSENTYNNNFSGEWRIKNYVGGNVITVNGVKYNQIAIDGKLMTIDASKNVTVLE